LIRSAYVSTARLLGRMTDRIGLTQALEARPGHASRYVRSLFAIYDVDRMLRLDVPWWTFRAIEEVERHLAARRGMARVFEFGSGASTVWLARRSAEVHSVEHDATFADQMLDAARSSGARLLVVPATPSDRPNTPSKRRGHEGLDFSRYVATIDDVGGLFDLIVIDGRARTAALQRSVHHLAPGGLVVFDDAWRVRYRPAMSSSSLAFTRTVGLAPALPYPSCTALGRSPSPNQ